MPSSSVASGASPPSRPLFQRASGLLRWESVLLVILVLLVIEGTRLSKFFLTGPNFANLTSAVMEVAIVALPMTLIIITGEIDLSVEAMIGLLGGILNGLLVARVGLPSLVVTLGTLALFRGLAN